MNGNRAVSSLPSANGADPILDDLLEELTAKLQAGEAFDIESYVRRYPERGDLIRQMVKSLAVLGELGHSAIRESNSLGRPMSHHHPQESGVLGDYRIIGEVGRGGMGVVYEAEQISLGRRVALKVLPFAPALDARQLQRFQNEARAAAHLNHANVVPVYAVGCERGVHYYAMQYIEGQSLSALVEELRRIEGRAGDDAPRRNEEAFALASELASGRFAPVATATLPGTQTEPEGCRPSGEAGEIVALATPTAPTSSTRSSTRSGAYFRTVARMGMQAAQALEHAHQQGVIHRDIKPSNLLVDMRGNLWVADFGLARFQSEAGLTMTGDILGTLRYMSPEQALGKSGMADYRTDIYSLGVTLYELLTLEPTYAGRDRQEILRRIAFEEPRLPRRLNNAIPVDLETVVLKAMAKDPASRYATAQELADDLGRFVKCEPIKARRSNAWERSVKWAQRRPAVAALLASIVVVFLAGFAGVSWQWLRAERAREGLALANQSLTDVNETLRKTLYFNRIALAERELAANNMRRVDQLLADCPTELRGWEWNYLKRARAGYRPIICHAGTQVVDVAFSPDGRRIVTAQLDGSTVIWDAATGERRHVLKGHGPGVRGVAYSPDGWRIASNSGCEGEIMGVSSNETMIWDATTGELIDSLKRIGWGWSVEFSPDGRLIAAASNGAEGDDRAVMIWDATTLKLIRTILNPSGTKLLTFSPDSARLALTHNDDIVTVVEVKTGKTMQALSGHTGGSHRMAFSRDGRYLAVACGPLLAENYGSIKIWDVAAAKLLRSLEGHTKIVWGVAYSPDGRRLASASFDHTVKIWDPNTGQDALTLRGHTYTVVAVAFSPDGQRLASASEDGTIRIWDASPVTEPPPRELLTFTGHTNEVRTLAYSPDGLWVASAGDDMVVRLWDAASGRVERLFKGHAHPVSGLAFSPDGRRIVSGDHGGRVRIWDVATGAVALALDEGKNVPDMIMGIAYSPNGLNFATAGNQFIDLFDATTGKHLRKLPKHPWMLFCVAFSRDGSRIASGSRDGAVKVSDSATGRLIKTVNERAGRTSALAFSPDDRYLAAAGSDGSINVWDTTNWAAHASIPAHRGGVLGLAYSPDGRRLASSGADQAIKLWDRASGHELLSLRGHLGEVNAVSFSPDGKRLASASGDHTIKIWDVMPGPQAAP